MAGRLFISLVEITLKEGEMVFRESLVQERMRGDVGNRVTRRPAGRRSVGREPSKMLGACCNFAEAVDWQFCAPSGVGGTGGDGVMRIRLTENEEALHVGNFIGLKVAPPDDTVELRGGCFNSFHQPATVYEEFLQLSDLSEQRLQQVLMDMHDRLEKYYKNYVKV